MLVLQTLALVYTQVHSTRDPSAFSPENLVSDRVANDLGDVHHCDHQLPVDPVQQSWHPQACWGEAAVA